MGGETKTVIYVTDQGQNPVFVQVCRKNFNNLKHVVVDYSDKVGLEEKIKMAFNHPGPYLFILDCQSSFKSKLGEDIKQEFKEGVDKLASKKEQLKSVARYKMMEGLKKRTEQTVLRAKEVVSQMENEIRGFETQIKKKLPALLKVEREYKRIEGQVKRFLKRAVRETKEEYDKLEAEISSIRDKIKNKKKIRALYQNTVEEGGKSLKEIKGFLTKQKELKNEIVQIETKLEDKLKTLKPQVLEVGLNQIIKCVSKVKPLGQINYLVVGGCKVDQDTIRSLLKTGEQLVALEQSSRAVLDTDSKRFVKTLGKATAFYNGTMTVEAALIDFLVTDYNPNLGTTFQSFPKVIANHQLSDLSQLSFPRELISEQVNLVHQRLGSLKDRETLNSVIAKMKRAKNLSDFKPSNQGTAVAIQYITR